MPKSIESASRPLPAEPESLAELRGDCVRMARRRPAPSAVIPPSVAPSRIRGITVPAHWAELMDGMSEYGG